ncbi:hypothetical protein TNCT_607771 [Trichonephila clavata]|uniref:Uncharacterized protein n=1 Tax=Trichonephila clavata TaxID=2740835 RepID=A0A8X6L2D3_TRICU|nr:hypothetical protein TNCT_607771 [Trichonephila clavata]
MWKYMKIFLLYFTLKKTYPISAKEFRNISESLLHSSSIFAFTGQRRGQSSPSREKRPGRRRKGGPLVAIRQSDRAGPTLGHLPAPVTLAMLCYGDGE